MSPARNSNDLELADADPTVEDGWTLQPDGSWLSTPESFRAARNVRNARDRIELPVAERARRLLPASMHAGFDAAALAEADAPYTGNGGWKPYPEGSREVRDFAAWCSLGYDVDGALIPSTWKERIRVESSRLSRVALDLEPMATTPGVPGTLDGPPVVQEDEEPADAAADYAAQWEYDGEEWIRRVPDAALVVVADEKRYAAAPGRFRLYAESELGEFPSVEWFPGLDGILPMRELVGLWGPGDSYKSFVALDWACELARLDFDVLYIAAEGASGLQGRIAAWKQHRGVESLPHLRVMPSPVKMHDPADVASFVAAVELQLAGVVPDLVIVDTLARNFVGGNENSAQDMGLFVEGAEQVRRRFGCTVAVVHHATKEGSTERGGESLRNASFAMFRFDRSGKRSVKVVCERMKDAATPEPVKLSPLVIELDPETSSLVADWPYGETQVLAPADADMRSEWQAKRDAMRAEIVAVVKSWGSHGDRLSQTQICKRVNGRDTVIASLAKDLALDPISPVQSGRDVKADGTPGTSIRYWYDIPPISA